MLLNNNYSCMNSLLGFAVADALGVPVEFSARESLDQNPVTGMRGFGTYNLPAGTWSDDTSMTLATIKAVADNGCFDLEAVMKNFDAWLFNAEFTSAGDTFDVGNTCSKAIYGWHLHKMTPAQAGCGGIRDNGNGSLMRFLPVPFYCIKKELPDEQILNLCNDVSSLTHSHDISRLGCYIYTHFMIDIIKGIAPDEAYGRLQGTDYGAFSEESISVYSRILKDDISKLARDDIKSSGYIVDTLEAAFWCNLTEKNYGGAVLKAVNLGHDTDTVGAITGSIAGVLYGSESIPKEWLETLIKREYIEELAESFDRAL